MQAVVVATGFEHFDASRDPRYEYGKAPNVIGMSQFYASKYNAQRGIRSVRAIVERMQRDGVQIEQ